MAFIYLLHFDTPLSHAEHYVGCTEHLHERLMIHASGRGANLTKVLAANGAPWRLAALGLCSHSAMKRVERTLKDSRNVPRYCPICNPENTPKMPGTQPYALNLLQFAATSKDLAPAGFAATDVTLRMTSDREPPTTMLMIQDLMKKDKDALGFVPAGGREGTIVLHDTGRIAIVSINGQDAGYLTHTLAQDRSRLNFHQCCIRDDARLAQLGRAMVDFTSHAYPQADVWAPVRVDIPAIFFWSAIGFRVQRSHIHKTSGKQIQHFHRLSPIRQNEQHTKRRLLSQDAAPSTTETEETNYGPD